MAEPKRTWTYLQRFLGGLACSDRLHGTAHFWEGLPARAPKLMRGIRHRVCVAQCQLSNSR